MSTKLIIAAAALVAFAGTALAETSAHGKHVRHHVRVAMHSSYAAVDFGVARGAVGGGLQGFPTDYLTNRFGDHQAQGR